MAGELHLLDDEVSLRDHPSARPHAFRRTGFSRLLGEVDPLVVERILSTGATADEIVEALRTVEDERGFGEQPHDPSTPAVAEVRAVLQDLAILEGDDPDDEERM